MTAFLSVTALLPIVHTVFGRRRRGLREVEAEIVTDSVADGDEFTQPAAQDEAERATDSVADGDEFTQPAAQDKATALVVELEPDAPESVIPIPEPPSVSLKEWTCEIAFWHGHEKATFYARTFRAGEELVVAESEPFEIHGDADPEETDAARKAHDALCEQLVQTGWERLEREGEWYSDRFRRDFTVAGLVTSLTTRISFARRPTISG